MCLSSALGVAEQVQEALGVVVAELAVQELLEGESLEIVRDEAQVSIGRDAVVPVMRKHDEVGIASREDCQLERTCVRPSGTEPVEEELDQRPEAETSV